MRSSSFAPLALLALGLASASASACASAPPPVPPAAPIPVPGPALPPAPVASASAAPAASAAATPPPADDKFAKVVIKVNKVAGNVYMLEGAGGNIGVSVGDDGIVLVDDQFAPLAAKIKDALKGLTDKPVRVVLNTHWHGDHTGGNALFGGTAAPIIAHENVRKRLEAGRPEFELAGKKMDAVPPAPHEALPIVTFQDRVSVHLNGEEIRAIHFPAGHTDGDVVIHFTRSNVVHMGDDFVTYGFPFVDHGSGGTVKGMIAAVDKVIPQLPADVKIIPGHGAVSSVEDLKTFSAKLKDCVKLVEAEVKKKKTLEQVVQAKPLAKYDDWGKGFIKTDAFVESIYRELTNKPAPPGTPVAAH